KYASVSTMTPEHFSQTSSVPINSRAQTSGSRSKKDAGRNGSETTKGELLLVRCRVEWLVVNWQRHAAFDGFALAECGNKRCHSKIFRGGAPEPDQRWIFGDHVEFLEVSFHVDFHRQFDDPAQLRGHGVSRIMEPLELRIRAHVRLRAHEVAFFFYFRGLLVGEDAQAWLPILDLESDGAVKEDVNRLALMKCRHEDRRIQAANQFSLE